MDILIIILLGVLTAGVGLLIFLLFRRPGIQAGDPLQAASFVQQ